MELKVPCDSIKYNQIWSDKRLPTCSMSDNTTIRSPKTMAEWNPRIEVLYIWKNKKVSYLPVDLYSSFYDLKLIIAYSCSLKAVSRENFRNLTKVFKVNLDNNQIRRIRRGTFSDLISLRELYLRESFILISVTATINLILPNQRTTA